MRVVADVRQRSMRGGVPVVGGPESASRTASRFGLCQPISDPFGPTRTTVYANKSGALWSSPEIWIGSGGGRRQEALRDAS